MPYDFTVTKAAAPSNANALAPTPKLVIEDSFIERERHSLRDDDEASRQARIDDSVDADLLDDGGAHR